MDQILWLLFCLFIQIIFLFIRLMFYSPLHLFSAFVLFCSLLLYFFSIQVATSATSFLLYFQVGQSPVTTSWNSFMYSSSSGHTPSVCVQGLLHNHSCCGETAGTHQATMTFLNFPFHASLHPNTPLVIESKLLRASE